MSGIIKTTQPRRNKTLAANARGLPAMILSAIKRKLHTRKSSQP